MAETEKAKNGLPGSPGLPPRAPGRYRAGTLNVQGISGKVSEVVDIFRANHLNLLGLQELQLGSDLIATLRAAVAKAGLFLLVDEADCWRDKGGKPGRGVAIIADHPAALDRNPFRKKHPGRLLFTRVHIPRRRPLRLCTPYLDASDAAQAKDQAQDLLTYLIELGDAALAIGDWNLEQGQQPLATLLSKGAARAADDAAAEHEVQRTAKSRVIDYGILLNGAPPSLQRAQVAGVGDHDLVYYEFDWGIMEEVLSRPPRKPLGTEEVSPELWQDRLTARQDLLTEAREAGDAAAELVHLMDAAEEALTGQDFLSHPGLPRRSQKRRPIRRPLATRRSGELQSATERSLRKLARKLAENGRAPRDDPNLHRNIYTLMDSLARRYPEIWEVTWDVAGAQRVKALAKEQAKRDKKCRSEYAATMMEECEVAQRRWVKKEPAPPPPSAPATGPVHPQEKAEAFAKTWDAIMRPRDAQGHPLQGPLVEGPDRWLGGIPQGGWMPNGGWSSVRVTGKALRRQAQASVGKGTGTDGWSAAALLLLPDDFWNRLAAIWNKFLEGARLPAVLTEVRTVGVPKDDGGERPISLAQVLWRLANTVVVDKLTTWVDQWAPEELCGGLRGRSAETIYAALEAALTAAHRTGETFSACKEDVRRAFPSIRIPIGLHVLKKYGLPQGLAD